MPDRSHSSSPNPRGDEPPPKVPNFTLFQCIGEGGYGKVWLGRDAIGQRRAIKAVYRTRFGDNPRPFFRELDGIKRYAPVSTKHDSLLKIFYIGPESPTDQFYYVMELADDLSGSIPPDGVGYTPKTLRSLLDQSERLPAKQCISAGLELATALNQLHERGLVHRDIKPSNIVFVDDKPKLADIGVVAPLGDGTSNIGTEGFIAPEGAGKAPADVFSLGRVLYVAATGLPSGEFPELPFEVLSEDELKGLLELKVVLNRACQPVADWRYQTAAEMRLDLLRLEAGDSLLERERREERKAQIRRYAPWAAVVVLAFAAGVGVWFQKQAAAQEARRAVEKAAEESRRAAEKAERAAEMARRRDLLASNVQLVQDHPIGWSTQILNNCITARLPWDNEIATEVARGLTGMDARWLYNFPNFPATAAAFARDGRAVAASDGSTNAILIETNGSRVELPVASQGPVTWTTNDVPLQCVARSNLVELCEMQTGRVRRTFNLAAGERVTGGDDPVLTMTCDASRVAAALAGTQGMWIVVWDVLTGKSLGEMAEGATALAFSPDGLLLAAGKPDGGILVYSLPNLEIVSRLRAGAGRGAVSALAFGQDRLVREGGKAGTNRWLLASGTVGGRIVIWDVDAQEPRSFCLGSLDVVLAVAFHPDGLTLASSGRNDARLWDVTTGRPLLRLTGQGSDEARALAFNWDGSRLVWGSKRQHSDASVGIWELVQGPIQVLRGLSPNTRMVWFSPDNSRIVALANDWQLAIWEASGRLLWMFEVPKGWSPDNAAVAFDTNANRLAFAAGTQALLYDLQSGRVVKRWKMANGLGDQLQFDGNGRLLLLRCEEKAGPRSKRIWRLRELSGDGESRLLHEQTDTNWVSYFTVLPATTKRFIVANGGYGTRPLRKIVKVFDTSSGQEVGAFEAELDKQDTVVFADPTGMRFSYLADAAGRARIIELENLAEVETLPTPCLGPFMGQSARLSGRGMLALGAAYNSGGAALGVDWRAIYYPYLSPNGKLLAWGTAEGAVLVADLEQVRRHLDAVERALRERTLK